jgi:chemotaxis signal transduction protein
MFRVARGTFALDATRVRGLLPMHDMIRLEEPEGWIVGIAAVRGIDFPVVDVRGKLGIPHGSYGRRPCIVAVEVATPRGPQIAGFIADRVSEVMNIRKHEIEEASIRTSGHRRRIFDPDLFAGEIEVSSLTCLARLSLYRPAFTSFKSGG